MHICIPHQILPSFSRFPTDNETYPINSQFMWGSSLLISPILEEVMFLTNIKLCTLYLLGTCVKFDYLSFFNLYNYREQGNWNSIFLKEFGMIFTM